MLTERSGQLATSPVALSAVAQEFPLVGPLVGLLVGQSGLAFSQRHMAHPNKQSKQVPEIWKMNATFLKNIQLCKIS